MSEQAQAGGQNAAGGTPAAAVVADPATDTNTNPGLEHALKDVQKFKRAAQEAQAQIDELKRQSQAAEDQKLQEKNEFKTLYERTKSEKEELQGKLENLGKSLVVTRKMESVKAAARKAGIMDSAESDLELLDLDGIEIETTSRGTINVLGADEYIAELKRKRPHWFGNKVAPKINSGGAGTVDPGQPITPDQVAQLEQEGRRKGDMSEYHKVYQLYKAQRTAGKK